MADPNTIACSYPAHVGSVAAVLNATPGEDGGRSEWRIFITETGDMIFGCFPQLDTYFEVGDSDDYQSALNAGTARDGI